MELTPTWDPRGTLSGKWGVIYGPQHRQTPAELQLKINFLAEKIKTSWLQFYYSLTGGNSESIF